MKTILIKCGGSVIDQLSEGFFSSIKKLQHDGFHIIFVHGGGPDINEMLDLLSVKAEFHNGLRKTTEEALAVVEMVLSGKTNRKLVDLLRKNDLYAVGINGTDDNCLQASMIDEENLGYVGNVEEVNNKLILRLLEEGYIPVLTPLGITEDGIKLNINADYAASAVAKSLKVEQCLFVTDVEGIMIDGEVASLIGKEEVLQYIEEGQITGGMVPKVTSALAAIDSGLNSAMIVSGKKEFYSAEIWNGTKIVANERLCK
ncbi:acetylglutamate kinase [Niallia taxi]|uniref:acetylglutamate kinase n=1 Tax=Niallia taxi TaxID=2499688 RepID=UPI0021A260DF|nr:acetylglutamate kinase [Niallia taxi]MCT2342723.1 acetylglutamate kinase [Niallia taxi]MDE5050976.1 acetylglutamate kinase [Niallia taxi]MED3962404.1 acetylglutamate kinase [Niallia taxi]WOD62557.1 acetylglutamate kinase [Niallia taxi]